MRIVPGGMTVRHLDVPPAFKRREEHKQVGCATSLILIIDAGGASRPHGDRYASFLHELFCRFIKANKRPVRIARAGVNFKDILHSRNKGSIILRRNYPLLPAVRLKFVFLKTRAIVLSEALSTMPSSTTLSSRRRRLQRL